MKGDWLNRQTIAWAGFDVASSVYFGIAPAVLLPLYFHHLMANFANPTAAWGLVASTGIMASSFAALAAAALTSRIRRFSLLVILTAGLVAAMTALAANPWASLGLAIAGYVAAQSFYFAATSIYESFLPDLLPQWGRQKLSGFGWAMGYAGGLFAIVVLLLLVAGRPEGAELLENCFAVLAIISAVFFVVVLTLMRRAGFGSLGEGSGAPRLSGVLPVIANWRDHKNVFLLLAGTMLVHLGISVVVTFTAPILATHFGQGLPDLLWLLALVHVVSLPSTIGWNLLMTRWSRLMPLTLLLAAWGVVLLLMAFGSGPWMPVATVSVIGCCVGGTASALRGFLAEVVPPGSAAAFFALATVAGRAAAALGPALFAVVSTLRGEQTALMAILVLMATGAVLVILHVLREDQPNWLAVS